MSDLNLETLLTAARSGDSDACRGLMDRLNPLVAKIVGAHAPRDVVVDEWKQEVFVRTFLRLDQFRDDAPLEHWVSRVAVTTCVDLLRRRKRQREIRFADLTEREARVLSEAVSADDAPVELQLEAKELVERLLDCLPAEDRVVLQMLDMQQMSVDEIAEQLGHGRSWVKVRAFRARKRLRPILQSLLGESERQTDKQPSSSE